MERKANIFFDKLGKEALKLMEKILSSDLCFILNERFITQYSLYSLYTYYIRK